MLQFKPGEILLNKYEISDLIGEGAFGGVYKARDTKLDRIVAVKFIRSSPGSIENFASEIEAVKRLEHPNIARLYDYDLIRGGIPCLVMEYVDGRELGDILSNEGPFNFERIGDVGCQVLDALVETHSRGIIHCDLKPENIMLTSRGAKNDVAKLIDFGVANLLSKMEDNSKKALVGTPQYMAPEQIQRRQIGPYTDIYAIGLILIELWTGQIVFDDPDPREVLRMQIKDPVKLPAELAQTALGAVIEKAVKKNPQERYQSTLEFYNDLKQAIEKMKNEAQWQHKIKEKINAKPQVVRERAYPSIFQEISDASSFDKFLNLDVSYNGRLGGKSGSVPLLNGVGSSDVRRSAEDSAVDPFKLFEGGHEFDSDEGIPPVKASSIPSGVPQLKDPSESEGRKSNPREAAAVRHESLHFGSLHESLSKLEKMDALEKKSAPLIKDSTSGDSAVANDRESEVSLSSVIPSSGSIRASLKDTQFRSTGVASRPNVTNSKIPVPQKKSRGFGMAVVFVIMLLLLVGGYFIYSSDMLSTRTASNITSSVEQSAQQIDTAIPGVRRATVVSVGKIMADVSYVSAVKGAVFDPSKVNSYDIIGTPVTADIYVQKHLTCSSTPCTIYTYGDPNKIEIEIRSEATAREPSKTRKMLLSEHKDPKAAIMLSVP